MFNVLSENVGNQYGQSVPTYMILIKEWKINIRNSLIEMSVFDYMLLRLSVTWRLYLIINIKTAIFAVFIT